MINFLLCLMIPLGFCPMALNSIRKKLATVSYFQIHHEFLLVNYSFCYPSDMQCSKSVGHAGPEKGLDTTSRVRHLNAVGYI